MKNLLYLFVAVVFASCTLLDTGIIIDPPNIPTVNICENVATDGDVTVMKEKIDAQSFKDEKMDRAKFVTKDYCFVSKQVVDLMDSFAFADDQLAIAKRLYEQTTDKNNYDIVADALAYKSDREELMEYISEH